MTEVTKAVFEFHAGTAPLLISMPHVGTHVPAEVWQRMSPIAHQLQDTDWHLPRLYACARELGASILIANYSRYVVDQNRPPDNASLYPGQSVTGLCPVDTFGNEPLYQTGAEPDDAEVISRRHTIWHPYHHQLQQELERLHAQFGRVVLWDAHSIRSRVPRFFDGKLPDLNFGTADGASCDPALAQRLLTVAQHDERYCSVLNGRFKGGYITRHYGDPARDIHAVQLEMAQCCYMEETWPFTYQEENAKTIQPLLEKLLREALAFACDK